MTEIKWGTELSSLSKSQQAIANYIMGALPHIPYCTDEDIARQAGVSTATVSRFWRAVGYANLKAFKLHLLQNGQATPAKKMKQILRKVDHAEADIITEIADIAASNVTESGKRLDREQFRLAVEAVHEARKLYLFGGGAAGCAAELLSFRLNRIGVDAVRMAASGSELLETLMHAGEGDVLLLFGFVKRTPELTVLLAHAKEAGCRSVLITDLLVSDMIQECDYCLQIDRGEMDGFHSMTAPIAVAEALAVGVTKRRDGQAMEKLDRLNALRKRYSAQLPK
ncbi:MurR/RpiR family transcriptional regulator [Paenibacillus soyae]|uniref:MurR/RpiR family transcriptional regulator n=1 Tax=Paenibacillus soyae TaxID=2969249 RepID=A0A9X2SDG4_9BACL|nr:MurR/RpiR family transcriptional regulator [Paenibacillus soyae]MCR2807863.1 MurR/RpiR family transcriptional regulator [Paenibacillus soyae]